MRSLASFVRRRVFCRHKTRVSRRRHCEQSGPIMEIPKIVVSV